MPSLSPMRSGAMFGSRVFLLTLLVCALACFNWSIWLRPTDWYSQSQGLKDIYAKMNLPFPNPDKVPIISTGTGKNGKNNYAVVMSGTNLFQVVLQWGSVMVAALSTAGLVAISRTSHSAQDKSAPTLTSSIKRSLSFTWLWVRYIATYPLPPRNFWSWACGGLNVAEFLFFSAYMGISVMYQYYYQVQRFANIASRLTPPPPAKGAVAPTSAQASANRAAFDAMFAIRRLEQSSLAFGLTSRIQMMLMFFPVSRSSFLKWALGSDFSSLLKYHRWMSWWMLIVVFLHSVGYVILYACEGTLNPEFLWEGRSQVNVTGLLSMLGGLAIGFTSLSWFRSNYYKIFFNVHILGFITFILFALMHYTGYVYWIVPSLILYGMDRAFRLYQLTNWTRLYPEDMNVEGSIVSLRFHFKGSCRVRHGQTIYIRVPALSWYQNHPYSVAAVEEIAPSSGSGSSWAMTLHIKVTGADWSRGLKRLASSGESMLVQVEGPYETSLDTAPKGPVVVMIGGGVGVTPILSVLRTYLASAAPPTAYFVWSCRSLAELKLLGSDLLCAASPLSTTKPHSVTLTMEGDAEKPAVKTVVKDSWLKTSLHYTGIETPSFPAVTTKGMVKGQDSQSASDTDGSPAPSRPASVVPRDSTQPSRLRSLYSWASGGLAAPTAPRRLLSAHPNSRIWVYCVCVLLAFFGGWAALYATDYERTRYGRSNGTRMDSAVVGTMQFFVIAIGIMLPPMLFLAALSVVESLWTRVMGPKATQDPLDSQDIDTEGGVKGKGAAGAREDGWALSARSVALAPGFKDSELRMVPLVRGREGMDDDLKFPGDEGLVVHRGRPDIVGMLKMVRQVHAGECDEVVVVVGGPAVQWDAVVEACCAANAGPGPILMPLRVAHQH